MTPIQDWADSQVDYQPGGVVTKVEARMAWVAWCSEERLRPGPGTGMGKAIVAAGGKARQKPTRWEHVALRPLKDSGYRVGNPGGPAATPSQVEAGLRALLDAGVVTDRGALNVAYAELTSDE